jgi:alpha-tubulin suppressor-like RCC1 family protein
MGSPGNHSAFIKSDGSLWTTGKNDDGQLANYTNSDLNTPTIVSLGSFAVSLGNVSLGGGVSIAAFDIAKVAIGGGHTIYVSTEGGFPGYPPAKYAYTTGRNISGQLGVGNPSAKNNFQFVPTYLVENERVIDVAAGQNHSLFLMENGSLLGTGANEYGQLGLGHENNQTSVQSILTSGVRHVAAGYGHTLFVKTDGSLWGMGRNDDGQLGLGDQVNRNQPTRILSSGVEQVAAGVHHTLIIKTDGSLWVMGSSANGQLGTGGTGLSLLPTKLENGGVIQVSAGCDHSLFIRNDGSLWGMGNNNFGELGLGDTGQRLSPVLIDSNVSQVSAGHDHTLYLDRNNTLFAMGANGFGQLGLGDTFSRTSPALVTTGVMRLSGIPPPNLYRSKVVAPDKAANDYFGHSVSQSGNILAVGAYQSDPDGVYDAGAAYFYQLESNGSTTYLSKVTAPDKAASDYFGWSVSQSGDILAVGAYMSDPDGVSDAGAAYLYRLEANGSATYLTKVTAPDKGVGDRFGISVSQSGNFLAVGAYKATTGGLSAGAAYLYELEANGSTTFLCKVTAPDKAHDDSFGYSVSQSGNILAVGAYKTDLNGLTDAGAAYLYELESNGSATLLTKVTAPDNSSSDRFGYSVSQSGNILAVGAYMSDPDGVTEAGSAYLYELEANGSVSFLSKLTAPDKNLEDWFGNYV